MQNIIEGSETTLSLEIHQSVPNILNRILDFQSLTYQESYHLMQAMMSDSLSEIQTSALLTALRVREINPQELAGFSEAMLDAATPLNRRREGETIDIVGTGGAKFKTFNVSTTSCFLMSEFGINVAKHGNRSSTSKSGSADLLEALGINIEMTPFESEELFNRIGLTFMFAPKFHPAMRFVMPVRRNLQIRTIFNLLGPLTNPAHVERQLTGIYDANLLLPIARSLKQRDFTRVALVYSNIGADEITNLGKTKVVELNNGKIDEYFVTTESFGLRDCNPQEISNLLPKDAAEEAIRILLGEDSPRADFVAINSAMALRVAGIEENLEKATEMVKEVLASGKALTQVKKFVAHSQGSMDKLDRIIEQL